MLPFHAANELARYEARVREADRRWRFLADEGLLGLADPAPCLPRPQPLRRLARLLSRARYRATAPGA